MLFRSAVTLARLHGVALAGAGRRAQAERVLFEALADARQIDARVEIAYTLDAVLTISVKKEPELRRERAALAGALGIERFPFATARARRGRRDRAR